MTTRQQLVIEGDLVSKVTLEDGKHYDGSVWHQETTHGTVKLGDWLDNVRAAEGTVEFLPPISLGHIAARMQKGNRSAVAVQLPPAIRSFVYTPDSRVYRVAMPHIVMLIQLIGEAVDAVSTGNKVGIYLYYRNRPVDSLDDELFFSNMPNIYANGQVCWGTDRIPLDAPLGRKVEMVIDGFFRSNFNQHELGEQWRPAVSEIAGHPQTFEEWETRSAEDPTFVLALPWRPAGINLRQALERGVK